MMESSKRKGGNMKAKQKFRFLKCDCAPVQCGDCYLEYCGIHHPDKCPRCDSDVLVGSR